MTVLVTGGLGYIGSHACVELIEAGHHVVIIDNLSNSKPDVLQRIGKITQHTPIFHQADIRDASELRKIFASHPIDAVMHFAGLKAVGESVEQPLMYYQNNVSGSAVLFSVMAEFGVKTLVFSSSATVYGDPCVLPMAEDAPLQPSNPYGRTKWMIEEILRDLAANDSAWRIAILRYFNPVGAHESGLIGEDPVGIPNNLMPYIAQVAVGARNKVMVFGNDYPTPDGTGIRDYIHVVDLVRGHLCALRAMEKCRQQTLTVNLGTGRGYSVLEVIHAFEKAAGRKIVYEVVGRRDGDIAECYADPTLAHKMLGWHAKYDLKRMCADVWRWQTHCEKSNFLP